ncbi:hypothetical protein [Candidatus Methylacidithermus pantelleriae]|uniref:hypothetical protein n=1 Tax=Candidatus Methylacidithermus pantelleriae TaxID=2744239 RepID=UPI00157C31AD|nr:hypothetical protein [Candidatus Methylacidithermus pantelleriae]
MYSVLVEHSNGLQRLDYCQESWEKVTSEPSFWLASWWSLFECPPKGSSFVPVAGWAEQALRKALREGSEPDRAVAFLLAGWLERKRLFREVHRETRNDDHSWIYFEHLPTGEVWKVPFPERITLQSFQEAQKTLQELWHQATGGSGEASNKKPSLAKMTILSMV